MLEVSGVYGLDKNKIGKRLMLFVTNHPTTGTMEPIKRSSELKNFILDTAKSVLKTKKISKSIPFHLSFGRALPGDQIDNMFYFEGDGKVLSEEGLEFKPFSQTEQNCPLEMSTGSKMRHDNQCKRMKLKTFFDLCYVTPECSLHHGFTTEMKELMVSYFRIANMNTIAKFINTNPMTFPKTEVEAQPFISIF